MSKTDLSKLIKFLNSCEIPLYMVWLNPKRYEKEWKIKNLKQLITQLSLAGFGGKRLFRSKIKKSLEHLLFKAYQEFDDLPITDFETLERVFLKSNAFYVSLTYSFEYGLDQLLYFLSTSADIKWWLKRFAGMYFMIATGDEVMGKVAKFYRVELLKNSKEGRRGADKD